ncbi:MAG: (2Fe-2S)-binding protein, partial [Planctomycetales bacterium]|nr:(2Fe-2S)-binding protein [Planctomycetales bacterium]
MVATTMVKITIDGRIAEVAPATTVLHAAEGLGISIPTLCHLEGCSPTTSCQICLVKNALTGQFVPSCATKVTDGMIVESETEEVHEMRRTALELLLSDHLGDCLAPCFFACPAHMDIPLMLQQIGDRHLQDAVATIKRDIAMPATLGRVCPKPCEKGCRRNASDEPVTVCELKRHVADVDLASGDPYVPTCLPDTGKRIAIVGAGPTGLAAAFYLRQQGHACDLFERQPEAGGRLHDECASGTLPIDVLRGEVRQVEKVGVNFHLATPIADRHAWDRLLDEFDVVVACCGASDVAQLQSWGLPVDKRGVAINKETYQTDNPRLFAAGNAIRGKGLVVRSIADGKEAAIAIGQYLVGEVVRGPGKPFSSRIGKLTAEEMPPYLAGA